MSGILLGALWIINNAAAATAEPPPKIEIAVDWNKTIAVSRTTPTIVACPFRPSSGASPVASVLQDAEFSVLRELEAHYVRWHLINVSRQVA